MELPHAPDVGRRKTGHIRPCPLQIGRHALHHRFAPAVKLLFLRNAAAKAPIEKDQIVVDGPCSRNACRNHPRLKLFDKQAVLGLDRDRQI